METITENTYKAMQLLYVDNTNSYYEIASVTEKAICIKCDDGKWGGEGYKPIWIAKSILQYNNFDESKERSQFGIHHVNLPDWFLWKNTKIL